MGNLKVHAGSLTVNGKKYTIGVHTIAGGDEAAVQAAAAKHAGSTYQAGAFNPATASSSFVEHRKLDQPEMGDFLTTQQYNQNKANAKKVALDKDQLEEADHTTALATSASADDIIDTAVDHGFVAGDRVMFTSLTGGTGLSTGVEYHVIAASLGATTFQVSETAGGSAVDFSTNITAGAVRFVNANPVEINEKSRQGDTVTNGAGEALSLKRAVK